MPNLESVFGDTARAFHRYIHAELHKMGLHRGQGRLMFKLWEEDGLTQKELAAKLNITPATLTRMVQNLETNGFITRRTDAKDQRVTRIHVSEKGKQLKAGLEVSRMNTEQLIFGSFSPEEGRIFEELLLRVQSELKKHQTEGEFH